MQVNIYQVDAFTDTPFCGNPAGVVPDANELSEANMQNIAREMNLSETAFIVPIDEDNYKVKFFTPICEVNLCGHATIATFYTLAKRGYIRSIDNGVKKVFQDTKAGKLLVEIYYRESNVYKVMMEQGQPISYGYEKSIDELLDAFGITKEDLGTEWNKVMPEIISTGLPDIILPIKEKDILDNLDVDFSKLETVCKELNVIGVHAFYLPKDESKLVYTRNFAPVVGIREEAATGTANGALLYYLKKNKLLKDNNIIAMQGEALNRPSRIHLKIEECCGRQIVKVGGTAKIVMEGILCI